MKKLIMILMIAGIGFGATSAFSDSMGSDQMLGHHCIGLMC